MSSSPQAHQGLDQQSAVERALHAQAERTCHNADSWFLLHSESADPYNIRRDPRLGKHDVSIRKYPR